jgi:hypothetical protein
MVSLINGLGGRQAQLLSQDRIYIVAKNPSSGEYNPMGCGAFSA